MQKSSAIALVISVSLLLFNCQAPLAAEIVSPQQLIQELEAPMAPLLIDVRTPQEYASGHIPGAINIDHRQVESRLDDIRSYGTDSIIVYCERGVRATRAERTLTEAGFEVRQLMGHMEAWRDANLPIQQSP